MNISKLFLNFQILFFLVKFLRQFRYNADQIKSHQDQRLKKLVKHAYQYPFYKERFDSVGLLPNDIESVQDLKKLPLLTKDEYRQFIRNEYDRNPNKFKSWYRDGTSGSTGIPLTIYRPWREQAYIIAKWLRELILNGYNPLFDKTFCLISPHRLVSKDSILQKIGLFRRFTLSYLASPKEMVSVYNETRPDLFYANKSHFVQMAEYAHSQKIALFKPKLYAVGAETMDSISRQKIINAFGENGFFETYGCAELGILAFQFKFRKEHFYFCHDTNILELSQYSEDGIKEGSAIVTDLYQYAFPLIRYCLNDMIEVDEKNGLRVVRQIKGRSDDWIIFEDGEKLSFHAFYEIMERRPEISKFRIIQESKCLIRIQVVSAFGGNLERTEKKLIEDLHHEVREIGMQYSIEWVKDIEPDPSGKLRMLISKVKQDV